MGGLLFKMASLDSRLDGKTVIITGSNIGIGLETAAELYARGGRVVLACRDLMKAEVAKKEIISRHIGQDGNGHVLIKRCDLSSLKSVRICAQDILKTESRIDVLINNAGIMMCPYQLTEDGYESQFATNHLGHFLLTMLLLPRILKGAQEKPSSDPSRIINLSSVAHRFVLGIDFDKISEKRHYKPKRNYFISKACNVLFTKYLAQRLEGKNVNVYAVHPGIVDTPLWKHTGSTVFPFLPNIMNTIGGLFVKSPLQGAQTTLHCTLTQETASETGFYYSDCKKERPSNLVQRVELADKLYELSLKMTNIDTTKNDPFKPEEENCFNITTDKS